MGLAGPVWIGRRRKWRGALGSLARAGKHVTVPSPDIEYVRFRSRYPNQDGVHIGIFGLVNVLGRNGMLTPAEETFRRENNAWYDAAYPDPCTVRPVRLRPAAQPRGVLLVQADRDHPAAQGRRVPGHLVRARRGLAAGRLARPGPGGLRGRVPCGGGTPRRVLAAGGQERSVAAGGRDVSLTRVPFPSSPAAGSGVRLARRARTSSRPIGMSETMTITAMIGSR